MIRIETGAKALRKIKLDSFFTAKYQISPYAGCAHQCTYCDGRSEKYHFEGDFERDLTVHIQCADTIGDQLKLAYERGPVLIGSGFTDAYQPLEKKFQLTRQLIINAQPHLNNHAIVLLTKSVLVERDIDILNAFAARRRVLVIVSLMTDDDKMTKRFEPNAPAASERLKLIESLKRAGIPVGVAAMPCIPYVTDRNQPLVRFFKRAQSAGADFIIPGALTLRPGINKQFFFDQFNDFDLSITNKVKALYSEERLSGAAQSDYLNAFYQHAYTQLANINMAPRIPMAITANWLTLYDTIDIFLSHLCIIYGNVANKYQQIGEFRRHYHALVEQTKKKHRGKQNYYQMVEQDIAQWLDNPFDLPDAFDPRLKRFLKPLLDGDIFDYTTKRWQKHK